MLLPDNISPEYCIFYNGSVVLQELKRKTAKSVFELYQRVKAVNEMSFPTFMLSLDWLYLIEAAVINEKGCVVLCS